MDKTIIKIIVTSLILLVLIVAIVLLLLFKVDLGTIKTASISWISERNSKIDSEGKKLAVLEKEYDNQDTTLTEAEANYEKELKKYEAISDETLQIIKDETREHEYSLEYLWVTLGNYAKAHKLSIAIIEPGGTTGTSSTTTNTNATSSTDTTVSTGTGVKADSTGKVTTNDTNKDSTTEKEDTSVSVTEGLSASTDAATIQVKGDYINLADFVYEVENDKDLRFRLDNINMKSAGGSDVIASFKVKNLTVIRE